MKPQSWLRRNWLWAAGGAFSGRPPERLAAAESRKERGALGGGAQTHRRPENGEGGGRREPLPWPLACVHPPVCLHLVY
ncbi:unnamed protein product [Tetraodon nigroviridis]|uniref:(spotted green pufferfish) hypothetical protein n=1 Tax=Tetraodon nigroviridis TaxID=99883 RepID=Q4T2K0_TETNG|nr:unnamed protein product [Tetraodon nigroviridis]